HLGGRSTLLLHDVDGDPAPVVEHGDGVVGVDGDLDLGAETGEGFVYRVVDDLEHQGVKAEASRGADVHRRAESHRGESLQDGDRCGIVVIAIPRGRRCDTLYLQRWTPSFRARGQAPRALTLRAFLPAG